MNVRERKAELERRLMEIDHSPDDAREEEIIVELDYLAELPERDFPDDAYCVALSIWTMQRKVVANV